ncbi:MAG: azurin, partial [Planctomycetes bacterium]|nr:azurin [Planctomycetota bacterium]
MKTFLPGFALTALLLGACAGTEDAPSAAPAANPAAAEGQCCSEKAAAPAATTSECESACESEKAAPAAAATKGDC